MARYIKLRRRLRVIIFCKPKQIQCTKKICDSINLDIYEIGNFTKEKKTRFYKEGISIKLDMTKKFEHF